MEQKPHSVETAVEIFTDVAPKYELLNSLMTAGMDRRWRDSLLGISESALGRKPEAALDLATGTGDVARLMAQRWPTARVVGTDPTVAMLDVARHKAMAPRSPRSFRKIEWLEGVAERIDAEDQSMDLVTIAFGFRNVSENFRQRAAEEAFRVLRPGGIFAILELGLPRGKIPRAIYKTLLRHGMPRFAGLFGPRSAYEYLARSIVEFPAPENVKKMLSRAGFLAFAPRPLSGGMTWLYIGKRPPQVD
jgi:demethylmenaquinone methyltransferase/2-methoxy-6-polyprenyl-1,4-benzoquinol methylase